MIKTDRLEIRTVSIDDWKAIQAIWLDQSKSYFAPYIKPKSLDNQSVFYEIKKWSSYTDNSKHHYYVICCNKVIIGYVALHRREDIFEIGYCFHSDYQGKGYAKESISALLDYMKGLGASRIMAQTALKNIPSVKLLLALGFIQTNTKKVSFYQDEKGKDIVFDDGVFELIQP